MSYMDPNRDAYGMYKRNLSGPGPELMGAGTLILPRFYRTQPDA